MKKNKIFIEGTVSEMAGSPKKLEIKVPVSKGVNLDKLTKGDKDPMFVIIEALAEGESKNGRYYTAEMVEEVGKQVRKMKPDAYEGHIKDEERPYKNPLSKTIWIGAKTYKIDGKKRLFVKGYVMPYAKELRQYLNASLASGKKVAVSIYGQAREVLDRVKKARIVKDFNLESIDWARTGSAGVETLGYLSIAREMEDPEQRETLLEMVMDARHEIESDVRSELEHQYGEKLSTISEMLGVKENKVVDTIREMSEKLDKYQRDDVNLTISREINSRVDNRQAKKIIKRLVVAEMAQGEYTVERAKDTVQSVIKSDEGQTVIREMTGNFEITPNEDHTPSQDKRKFTKITKK